MCLLVLLILDSRLTVHISNGKLITSPPRKQYSMDCTPSSILRPTKAIPQSEPWALINWLTRSDHWDIDNIDEIKYIFLGRGWEEGQGAGSVVVAWGVNQFLNESFRCLYWYHHCFYRSSKVPLANKYPNDGDDEGFHHKWGTSKKSADRLKACSISGMFFSATSSKGSRSN